MLLIYLHTIFAGVNGTKVCLSTNSNLTISCAQCSRRRATCCIALSLPIYELTSHGHCSHPPALHTRTGQIWLGEGGNEGSGSGARQHWGLAAAAAAARALAARPGCGGLAAAATRAVVGRVVVGGVVVGRFAWLQCFGPVVPMLDQPVGKQWGFGGGSMWGGGLSNARCCPMHVQLLARCCVLSR